MTHTPHRTQTEPLVAALGGGFKSATVAVNGVALHCVHGGFAYVFKFGAFAPAEMRHYVEPYAATTQLHAACEMYRALPAQARDASAVDRELCALQYRGSAGSRRRADRAACMPECREPGLRESGAVRASARVFWRKMP